MKEIIHSQDTIDTLSFLKEDLEPKGVVVLHQYVHNHNDKCPCCKRSMVDRNNRVRNHSKVQAFVSGDKYLITFLTCKKCAKTFDEQLSQRGQFYIMERIARTIEKTITK